MEDVCSEGACYGAPLDEDDDTYVSDACGGDDCDDGNGAVNPGVLEQGWEDPVCGDGLDNDCDGYADLEDPGCAPT
jgi:hypothetical protein